MGLLLFNSILSYYKNIMKHKILVLLFGIFSFGLSGVFAQEIGFSYGSGQHFGKGCTVAVDVTLDAQGKKVATTDIMLESSMKYVDFVPNKNLFPYYFPPITRSNGLIHIVGFTVFPNQVITTSGTIWTLYFQANPTDTDASIKIYFLWSGNTTDTNLSYGGVDQLQHVGQADFVMDQAACVHDAAIISGWFAGVSYQDALDSTINQINGDLKSQNFWAFFTNNISLLIVSIILLILIVLLIVYHKKVSLFVKHRFAWKEATR